MKFLWRLLLCLGLMCFTLFTACSNHEDDVISGAIICNGKVCSNLISAFAGGGIADPEIGAYSRLEIFDKSYSSYPSKEVAKVSIGGLVHPYKTYKGNGDHLESIQLGFIDKYEVNLSLNQGIFEGKDSSNKPNADVSSVTIHSYSLGEIDASDNKKRNAHIHITIQMKDSSVIEIRYSGKVLLLPYY